MSTLKVNSIEPANAGSEDYFLVRAWVNFDGKGADGVRGSGNVSSVTDLGTGYYQPNFTNAFASLTYNYMGISGSTVDNAGYEYILFPVVINTGSIRVRTSAGSGAGSDTDYVGLGFII